MTETNQPFAMLPQEVLYSTALDDLDIRILCHFYATYRLQGELGQFEYSVPATQKIFPKYQVQKYRRKFAIYYKAGVLKLSRHKTQYGKKIPLYTFNPDAVKSLCGLPRPHSNDSASLCSPDRPHSEKGSDYVVCTDRILIKLEKRDQEGTNNNKENSTNILINNNTGSFIKSPENDPDAFLNELKSLKPEETLQGHDYKNSVEYKKWLSRSGNIASGENTPLQEISWYADLNKKTKRN